MKSSIRLCIASLFLGVMFSASADTALWKIVDQTQIDLTASEIDTGKKSFKTEFQNALYLKLDERAMRLRLQALIASNKQATKSTLVNAIGIPLPLPNGSSTLVKLVPEATLPVSLSDKFPEILSYRILPDTLIFGGKVDISPNGFHAMLQTLDGELIFIDPISTESNIYVSYKKSEQQQDAYRSFSCGAGNQDFNSNASLANSLSNSQRPVSAASENLLNYRIAIAATGEYTALHGGTVAGALSAITTSLNRVNLVMERDLGIHLQLVENNHLLISTDSDSDPFTKTDMVELVAENQAFIDTVIGTGNYDLGHLFKPKVVVLRQLLAPVIVIEKHRECLVSVIR